jgi:acetolactate synthase-1/2/3 large subunit
MNAASVLIRCLEAEGVRYIFGVPGEETLAILDALSHYVPGLRTAIPAAR